MTTADAQGPVETWVRGRFDCSMDGSDDVIAFARDQDAKLAQAEAERDKYKAESRSLNRERAAEVARADAAEAERDALKEKYPERPDCVCGYVLCGYHLGRAAAASDGMATNAVYAGINAHGEPHRRRSGCTEYGCFPAAPKRELT